MSFAEISLIGNVGKPPELKYSPQGKEFCAFSVAVNDGSMKDKDGKKVKQTTWFNVTCVGSLANVALGYVKKGEQVFLRGKLNARKFNGTNGTDVSLDIFATTIHLIGNGKHSDESHDEEDNTDFEPEKYEKELAASANAIAGTEKTKLKTK